MEKIIGQLSKISTTADQSVRLTIDIKYEDAQDVMTWLYQMVQIESVNKIVGNGVENGDQDAKLREESPARLLHYMDSLPNNKCYYK